jgi:predicted NAD-dependent protein-ADP-ribosyltransferase YbiA (DUF1768 family)
VDGNNIPLVIKEFRGDYRFLSNFYPVSITFEGQTFPSVECAYQAAKTTDMSLRAPFMSMTSTKAKRHGRTLPIRDH